MFLVLSSVACRLPVFDESITDVIEIDVIRPAEGVSGTVVSAGRITVPVTGGIELAEFRAEAMLSSDLGSSTGKILILAIFDTTQPWLNCLGASVDAGCTMLVGGAGAVGGFVSLHSVGRDITLFLESTFELGEAPAPGCSAFLVGGTPLQWHVPLHEDLLPGSTVVVDLGMRRSEPPNITLEWQLLLADPPVVLPEDQGVAECR